MPRKHRLLIAMTFSIISASALSGCGYSIRRGTSEALDKDGIRKIYIAPVVNDTYHYGIENVVYNSLVRSLASFSGIKLVSEPNLADAVLTGRVVSAESQVSSTGQATGLNPGRLPTPIYFGSLYITTVYNAYLSCSFSLVRREALGPNRPAGTVWTGNFNRTKEYPGSNQLGVLGTTSGLINDSEFDRTIVDISRDMMVDVREAMVSRF